MLGGAVLGLSSVALGAWAPAYVMRTFDLSATATGASFGAVAGGTAILGILGGGFIGGWLAHRGQIGRATCRERVCQYVSISGVAESIKKKNKKLGRSKASIL